MKTVLSSLLLFMAGALMAQERIPRFDNPSEPVPEWAAMMYGADPDVRAVQAAYGAYYNTHPFVKNAHTQYYMLWMIRNAGHMGADGHLQDRTVAQMDEHAAKARAREESDRDAGWVCVGPDRIYNPSNVEVNENANTYCIDRSATNPNLLFSGTEAGGAYKTVDGGLNWTSVTLGMEVRGVSAIRIQPTNNNVVLMCAEGKLWRTLNGGNTWTNVGASTLGTAPITFWEIAWDPATAATVLLATDQGLYRSTDTGLNWTLVLAGRCTSVVYKPWVSGTTVAYAMNYLPATGYARVYKSTNAGVVWLQQTVGWYTPPAGESQLYAVRAGRIAVTQADPESVYALLVGYEQAGASVTTNGWIGVWKSTNSAGSWTLPHGLIGAPYTSGPTFAHPNLMNFGGDNGTYTQIEYNTTMVVSQIDANKVLIGGLNLWQSLDGCATYTPLAGGYLIGGSPVHVDMQELRVYKTSATTEEYWLANDGGVVYTSDFFANVQVRSRGIDAVDLWGYDQGWGEDMMVGGRYHNGDMAYHENYPSRSFLIPGGAESATGYVNHSDENRTYFSDIGTVQLPEAIGNPVGYSGLGMSPNESYGLRSSSRIMSDHRYYDMLWLGRDSSLFRSMDGGASFQEFRVFGGGNDYNVLWMEQAYSDPNVMVVQQNVGGTSVLWRTADGGTTWSQIPLPQSQYDLYFTLSATDPQEMWVAYTYGANGAKVYRTTNAGSSWQNITTPTLDNEEIFGLVHQYGTNGGVYVACKLGRVLYRNNTLPDWAEYSTGLPAACWPLRMVPFYKGGKIRIANYGNSVWQRDLYEPSSLLVDFSTEASTFTCPGDPVHFVDHSVCSASATYAWSFPGGTPSTSTAKNPTVTYSTAGPHAVTLTVTDNSQVVPRTKSAFVGQAPGSPFPYTQGFEAGVIPADWKVPPPSAEPNHWQIAQSAGGFGTSSKSLVFPNYYVDVPGLRTNAELTVNLSVAPAPVLSFDVAYAQYDNFYSDTLAVLVSTDCGVTWSEFYVKGGDQLATAPDAVDPFVPTATQWRTESVPLQQFTGFPHLTIAFQDRGRFGQMLYVDNVNISSGVLVSAKAWLEGPYNTNTLLMDDALRSSGLIPLTEPYSALGFTQAAGGGGEMVPPSVLAITGNNAIVDWVLVELRAQIAPYGIVATRSALLQRDGDIVSQDGQSPVTFKVANGSYRVAVRHRNHLGIMRASANALSATAATVDFRISGTTTYGTAARKTIGAAEMMWAGNVKRDVSLKYTGSNNDRDPVLITVGSTTPNNAVSGYFLEDVNLSGQVKYTGSANDRDPILVNIGSTTPNNIRTEQLP